jgi:large subunit ribosomal protein L15
MRLPKRGFNNIFAKDYAEVNLGRDPEADRRRQDRSKKLLDHDALKACLPGARRQGRRRCSAKGEFKAKASFKVAGRVEVGASRRSRRPAAASR